MSSKRLSIIIAILFLTLVAGSAEATDIKINAGVLPSIWYSSLNISKNDQINIYGGIQNHSDIGFSFTAIIFIDGTSTFSSNFISNPGTLVEIAGPWKATVGSHTVQLKISNVVSLNKISTSTIGTDSLLVSESNSATISVTQVFTYSDMEKTVSGLAATALGAIDSVATSLADNIESLKKPILDGDKTATSGITSSRKLANSKTKSQNNIKNKDPLTSISDILKEKAGLSLNPANNKKDQNQSIGNENQLAIVAASIMDSQIFTSIYNKVIDFLSLMVKNWGITLFVILAIVVIMKF